MKNFFLKNYFYAGFLFLLLALYEVYRNQELSLLLYLCLAIIAGGLFSHLLCFRHNHNHMRKIIFIPIIVLSNAFHVCVDAVLLLSNYISNGLSIFFITLFIMLPHELLRQPAHIKTLLHEGVSIKYSYILITGIYFIILFSVFNFEIREIPAWLHDATIITYGFLAGEILWHERASLINSFKKQDKSF